MRTTIKQAGEEIPSGSWRGGEEIPPGGWRGGEEIPPGGWRGGEEIPPGGWRVAASAEQEVVDVYRTLDGRAHFTFRFVPVEGQQLEADVLHSPVGCEQDVGLTSSRRDGYRLLETASSLQQARRVAGEWAERAWVNARLTRG